MTSSYQHGFVYIRRLALYLKNSLANGPAQPDAKAGKKNSNVSKSESKKIIFTWRYLNSLRVWAKLLCAYPDKKDGLGELVYPFIQIVMGLLELPESKSIYLPTRLFCIGLLNQVSRTCDVYIPVLHYLLEVCFFFLIIFKKILILIQKKKI